MKLTLCLSLILLVAPAALGSRILFYIPFAAKSSCITMVSITAELVNRGHDVTVVTVWDNLKFDKRVKHIVGKSNFDTQQKQWSNMLFNRNTSAWEMMSFSFNFMNGSIGTNIDAMERVKPLVEGMLDNAIIS